MEIQNLLDALTDPDQDLQSPFIHKKTENAYQRGCRNIKAVFPKRLAIELIEKFPNEIDDAKVWKKNAYKSVFIHGPSGTGKTFAAACMSMSQKKGIKSLMYRVHFVIASDLLRALRNAIGKPIKLDAQGKTETEAMVEKCLKTHILILDDIGVEKQSDYVDEILYTIINYRYNEMKQTIVTSNFSPQRLVERLGDDRLISRLTSMGPVLVLKKKKRIAAK
jgi:DNA replication protein DnaC